MKRFTKLLSLLMALCMVASCVTMAFAVDEDTEPPVIDLTTLEVDSSEIGRDGKVKIKVKITDDSEIQRISVMYNCNGVSNGASTGYTRTNIGVGEEDRYDSETGWFEAEVFFDNGKAYYGTFEINDISAEDVYGNVTHMTEYFYADQLDAGTFRVTGGNPEDKAGPVIDYQNIVVDKKVAEGEKAKISIPITDDSEIYYAQVCYASANAVTMGAVTPIYLTQKAGTNLFEGEVPFDYLGENNLVYIVAIDANRNQSVFDNTEYTFYPRDKVIDSLTTATENDVSYADVFHGDGSVNDTEKPVVDVSSIALEKRVVEWDGTGTISVKISDASELKKVGVSFLYMKNRDGYHTELRSDGNGVYTGVLSSASYGQYRLGRIEVVDVFGNTTILNDSSLFNYVGEELPDTDLSAGDYYVGVVHEGTGVSVSDTSMDNTTKLEVQKNELSGDVFNRLLEEGCDAHAFYNVSVEGMYGAEGEKTALLIPAPDGLQEGDDVRVVHLKSDDTTENLDTTVKNGFVTVKVTEFSPFLLETGFTPAPDPDKANAEELLAELKAIADDPDTSETKKLNLASNIAQIEAELAKAEPNYNMIQSIGEASWAMLNSLTTDELLTDLRNIVDSYDASAEKKQLAETAIAEITAERANTPPDYEKIFTIGEECWKAMWPYDAQELLANLRDVISEDVSAEKRQLIETAITQIEAELAKTEPDYEKVFAIGDKCWADLDVLYVREYGQELIAELQYHADSPLASAEETEVLEAAIQVISDELAKDVPDEMVIDNAYSAEECGLSMMLISLKEEGVSVYTPEANKQIIAQALAKLEKAQTNEEKWNIYFAYQNERYMHSKKDTLLDVIACEFAPAEAVQIAKDALAEFETATDEDKFMLMENAIGSVYQILAPVVNEKVLQLLEDPSLNEVAKSILQRAADSYENSNGDYCALNQLNMATDIIALDQYAKAADSSATVKMIATEALKAIAEVGVFDEIQDVIDMALIDIQNQPNVEIKTNVEIERPERGQTINLTAALQSNAMKATLSDLDGAIPLTTEEKVSGAWVWMEVASKTEETVDKEDAKRINKALNGATVGAYLDINLFKQVPGGEKSSITETDKPVTISIQVPEALRAANRKYAILYTHEGADAKTITPKSYNTQTGELVFLAYEFSTYALTYTEISDGGSTPSVPAPSEPAPSEPAPTEPAPSEPAPSESAPTESAPAKPAPEKPTNPQTGDSAKPWLYAALLILSVCGLGVVIVTSKMSLKGKYSK